MNPVIEKDLQSLVANGDIEHVLQRMRHLVDGDRQMRRELAFASGQWQDIVGPYHKGQIGEEEYNIQRNKFRRYLLKLIEDVSENRAMYNFRSQQVLNALDEDDFFHVYSNMKTPDQIWKGFVKDFKSYNDSWLMEYICPEDYLFTHRERYHDPKCGNYNFLFFPNSGEGALGWRPFIRFAKFQALVHFDLEPYQLAEGTFKRTLSEKLDNPLPHTLKYVRAYLNFGESPQQTFFRGFKYKDSLSNKMERVSIWYLTLRNHDELPSLILKSTNEQFWNELDRKWNDSRKRAKSYSGIRLFKKLLELPDDLFAHEVLVE